jgi:hypothetical protein
VSVFVIDWTTTGAPPPIWTLRTITAFEFLFILNQFFREEHKEEIYGDERDKGDKEDI